MPLYEKIIDDVLERRDRPNVKDTLIKGIETVGKVYEAGDKAAGLHEPMEGISDQISKIPVVGGPASFTFDVVRPDFIDVAAMKAGPTAGAAQYLGSLPGGVARATAKRTNPKQLESIIDGVLDTPRKASDWGKKQVDEYSDFSWVKGLEDLDPTGPTPIRAKGETKRKLASQHTTGVEVTPKVYKIFKESSSNALDAYQFKLDIKVGKVEDHHKGIIRQIFEATNGLLPHARKKGSDFISKNLGFELGYSGRNAVPLPVKFHPRIHALINKRIGSDGGYLGGYNLRGIEKKLNLPPDWQSTFTHRQRIPIYKELVSTIGDSVKQIDVFWDSLVSRTNLGSLSKEEYLETVLDVIDLDKRLLNVQNPAVMRSLGKGGTATEIINEILTKAGKIDMTSPIFKSLDKNLSKEALKLAIQENGYKALWEVIVSGQTPATVFKAYGIKPSTKLINAIKKDNNAYQHMLRSRGKSIPPADSIFDLGLDN